MSTEEKEPKREIRILGRRARLEFPRGRRVASGGLWGESDCVAPGKGSMGCDSAEAPACESSTDSIRSRSIAGQTGKPKGGLGRIEKGSLGESAKNTIIPAP